MILTPKEGYRGVERCLHIDRATECGEGHFAWRSSSSMQISRLSSEILMVNKHQQISTDINRYQQSHGLRYFRSYFRSFFINPWLFHNFFIVSKLSKLSDISEDWPSDFELSDARFNTISWDLAPSTFSMGIAKAPRSHVSDPHLSESFWIILMNFDEFWIIHPEKSHVKPEKKPCKAM